MNQLRYLKLLWSFSEECKNTLAYPPQVVFQLQMFPCGFLSQEVGLKSKAVWSEWIREENRRDADIVVQALSFAFLFCYQISHYTEHF